MNRMSIHRGSTSRIEYEISGLLLSGSVSSLYACNQYSLWFTQLQSQISNPEIIRYISFIHKFVCNSFGKLVSARVKEGANAARFNEPLHTVRL